MFGKKDEVNFEKFDTLIGKDTNFEGTLKASGTVRIEGCLKGDLISLGDLVITDCGKIEGNVEARNILLAGNVNGFIKSSGKVEIANTGKMYGDISVNGLIIEEGAVFQGKCLMDDKRNNNTKENIKQPS